MFNPPQDSRNLGQHSVFAELLPFQTQDKPVTSLKYEEPTFYEPTHSVAPSPAGQYDTYEDSEMHPHQVNPEEEQDEEAQPLPLPMPMPITYGEQDDNGQYD